MKPSEIFLRTLLILCNISFSTLAFSKGEALPQESNTATPQTTEQLLTISPGLERYSIGPYSYAIEDPSRSLKINDLLKIPSSEWQIIDRSTLSFGFNKSPHWFKTTIKNVSSEQSEWIYRLEYPPLDFVDFFVIRENTIISHQISGDAVNFLNRKTQVNLSRQGKSKFAAKTHTIFGEIDFLISEIIDLTRFVLNCLSSGKS